MQPDRQTQFAEDRLPMRWEMRREWEGGSGLEDALAEGFEPWNMRYIRHGRMEGNMIYLRRQVVARDAD